MDLSCRVSRQDLGPHLYEFSPAGNSFEYYAMSIGARSQSAKTYLEKEYLSFPDGQSPFSFPRRDHFCSVFPSFSSFIRRRERVQKRTRST